MPLSTETLHPLTLASFVLDYRMEGTPLQVVAKRYSLPEGGQMRHRESATEVTLLLTAGIGYNSELWLPTIKHLFDMQAQRDSIIRMRHVWTVEWPNHGDAAVVNEHTLKEHYPEVLEQRDVAIALRRLVSSGLMDLKASKLVGLSHSAATGSNMLMDSEIGRLPFDAAIIVEPPLFDRSALPFQLKFIARNVAFNKARLDVWPSLDDAINWHKTRLPWRKWHPDVLQVLWETNFRSLPTAHHAQTEGVTTKTYKGQDAASFNSAEELYKCADCLTPLCALVPVHLILGSRKDFWPKDLAEVVDRNIEVYRPRFASITIVPGVGHFVGQEDPRGLASAVFQALNGMWTVPVARL